jgi:hypothetical protein
MIHTLRKLSAAIPLKASSTLSEELLDLKDRSVGSIVDKARRRRADASSMLDAYLAIRARGNPYRCTAILRHGGMTCAIGPLVRAAIADIGTQIIVPCGR